MKERLKSSTLAILIFLAILLLTAIIYQTLHASDQNNRIAEIDKQANLVEAGIISRTDLYISALRSGKALIDSSETVTREEWKYFADAINLPTYFPGIQGFGYSEFIQPENKANYETAIQAEGFEDFSIRPSGERDVYTSITFLEPFDLRNQQAFGFDMYSEETRRAAMDRAMASGKAQLSGPVTLVQEIDEDVQVGFLIYVPVFENNESNNSTDVIGFVYSPFRARDFMEGITGDTTELIDYAIFDGVEVDTSKLMYDSKGTRTIYPSSGTGVIIKHINVANRTWTLLITPHEDDYLSAYSVYTTGIIPIGIIFALLASIITYLFTLSYHPNNDSEHHQEKHLEEIERLKLLLAEQTELEHLKQEIAELKKQNTT